MRGLLGQRSKFRGSPEGHLADPPPRSRPCPPPGWHHHPWRPPPDWHTPEECPRTALPECPRLALPSTHGQTCLDSLLPVFRMDPAAADAQLVAMRASAWAPAPLERCGARPVLLLYRPLELFLMVGRWKLHARPFPLLWRQPALQPVPPSRSAVLQLERGVILQSAPPPPWRCISATGSLPRE